MKILYIFITIPIILGNALVLLTTWRDRRLHQPSKYFIACLAVADLFTGMLIAPMSLYYSSIDHESRLHMSVHLCRFFLWLDILVLTASIYTLAFISFDRCLKIAKPLQYKCVMTTSKSLKIIFIIIHCSIFSHSHWLRAYDEFFVFCWWREHMTNNYRICHVLTPSETNTRFICDVLTPSELFAVIF